MKKLVIVGAGVAGLSAAIYGCKAGYEVEVYEKHTIVGGQCTGWKRKGFVIDNCIHWLTGTSKDSNLYQLWKEVDILSDEVKVLQPEAFYSVEIDGQNVTLWRDIKRAEKELIQIAPEDEQEIKKFFHYVRIAEQMDMPVDVPFDLMNIKDFVNIAKIGKASYKLMKEYGKINIGQLCNRFESPILKKLFGSYMPPEYLSYALLYSYATITSGNGGIPKGGSIPMAQRMQARLKQLGGSIFTNQAVEKIILEEGNEEPEIKAEGILLSDGREIKADYVIITCDTNHVFQKLLGKQYMHKDLQNAYDNTDKYLVRSGFQVAFSVPADFHEVKESLLFECAPIQIANRQFQHMGLRNYNYDDTFIIEGKTVLQTNFNQYINDYEYWLDLYQNNKEEYKAEKEKIANDIKNRILHKYPQLQNKLELLDVWTPVTYHRYVNAYQGAYMSFFHTNEVKNIRVNERIQGLSNVWLASQWLMSPGGLPCAAVEGKFAVQRILKKEKRNIRQL